MWKHLASASGLSGGGYVKYQVLVLSVQTLPNEDLEVEYSDSCFYSFNIICSF